MIIVLMGPAGAGKTTVGRALANATGWPFIDADDLHTAANVEKMRRGQSLDDRDRQPWLDRLRALIVDFTVRRADAVLACSALRERYRQTLTHGIPGVTFVLLDADRSTLERRLRTRQGHFAGVALLNGQLATMEVPSDAVIVSAAMPVAAIVAQVCERLVLPCGGDRGADR